jgi:cytochrome c oxidase accessory protein FixG
MGPAKPKIHPTEVTGKFRTRRTYVSTLLLIFFLVLPWVRIGGQPALLLNVAERKFSIFGFLFWGHDVPLLLFIAGIFIFTIMFLTAVFGRAWCGWACPQTVFIDRVFRRIETWIEGDPVKRRAFDSSPWTFQKFEKKALKWTLFFIAATVVSHSFLAYFVGTDRLAEMVTTAPNENPASFSVMLAFLGITLFDFGWFRERFCTHVCPYGRLQTVLLDDESWVVAYDVKRGEPRRGLAGPMPTGDCISCNKCVSVCPTGIDIRSGLQLECIACTACMDACDSVMRKIHRPEGLIGYRTVKSDGEVDTPSQKRLKNSILRVRPILYFTVLVCLAVGLGLVLRSRDPVSFTAIRAPGEPYTLMNNESDDADGVVNRFNFDFHNLTFQSRSIRVSTSDADSGVEIISPALPLQLQPGEQRRIGVFLRFKRSALSSGHKKLGIDVRSTGTKGQDDVLQLEEVNLVGPY